MASEISIYSIYKLRNEDKYYLLRTIRPGFSNASQNQQNLAENIEQNKRKYILDLIRKLHSKATFEFIGELQGLAIGDKLYADNGGIQLNIYYLDTEFGQPWIVLGNAASETDFLAELSEDEDLLRLKPIGQLKKITATFVTESDFDLSVITNLS